MDQDQSNRIEAKLDKVIDKQQEQAVIQERHSVLHEKNSEDLAEHIRRTNILEEQMQTALLPIRASKWLAGVAAAFLTLAAFAKLLIH